MTFSLGAMLNMSKISHIRKFVGTGDFLGSHFNAYGNVCNVVSCNFRKIITQHFSENWFLWNLEDNTSI